MTVTPQRHAVRAAPVLVFALLAAIGLLGVTGRGDGSRPADRRPVDQAAVAVVLPIAVVAGDVRFPQDSLTRSGRVEPGAATVGVDALAPDAPCGLWTGGHRCPRAGIAHPASAGAPMWRSRAPPRVGFDGDHA